MAIERLTKRLLSVLLLAILGVSGRAGAQISFVSATGTTASYANGTITAVFVAPANSSQFDYINERFPFVQSATLNGSGVWSLSVADTSTLKPAGSQWQFFLCSQQTYTAPPTCYIATLPVTCVNNGACSGSTLDLTSSFSAAPTPTSSVDSVARGAAAAAQTTANAAQTAANSATFGTLGAGTAAAKATFPGGLLFHGGVDAQSGTSYTVVASDENKLMTFNNAAATSVTLPAATTAGFTSGAFFHIFNRGAGLVTITPTTSTINGSATLTLAQNTGAFLESDGTNYSAYVTGDAPKAYLNGATSPSTGVRFAAYVCTFSAGNCTVTHAVPFTTIPFCTITEVNGGAPAGTTEPQVWINSGTTTAVAFAASSTTYTGQAYVVCMGT